MKNKIFTHTDWDGKSCAMLCKLAYSQVDAEYCNYDTINERVMEFIESGDYEYYDFIYITDISVNDEVAKCIDNLIENTGVRFRLLDHHKTAEYLNKYDWCTVEISNTNGLCCGTSLLYKDLEPILLQRYLYNKYVVTNVVNYVELVRRYDTWEWKNSYSDDTPSKYNDLFFLYPGDTFLVKLYNKILKTNSIELDFTDVTLLDIEKSNKESYFESKAKTLIEYRILDYNMGVVFAERYISSLGNYLSETYKHLDGIAIVNNDKVSFRTVNDVDLSKLAEHFGGGGHPKACGFSLDDGYKLSYIGNIFSNEIMLRDTLTKEAVFEHSVDIK